MPDTPERQGAKYLRRIYSPDGSESAEVDIYSVLDAYQVPCPARQHAVKKLLCAGKRGKGDTLHDLRGAHDSVARAIQMEERRNAALPPQ